MKRPRKHASRDAGRQRTTQPVASDPTRRAIDSSSLFGGKSQHQQQNEERARREREAQET
jgi:hypothetical protein